jgi:hypothetical protein
MKPYFLVLATLIVVCVGCQVDTGRITGNTGVDPGFYHAPPAAMMARPGPMVDGPGPGVLPMLGPPTPPTFATATSQIRFLGPVGTHIGWQIGTGYAENQLIAPGRYNFQQASTYRLKLTNLPDREGLVLYPSLQVYPAQPRTDAYLAHNSIPLQLTDEDLDQIQSNNFVTKVIYLPDPQNQELAIAGVETLVSTRLDPGVDPVAEADRRGTIMAVLRVGNMDLETDEQAQAVPGAPAARAGGNVAPVAHQVVDGEQGAYVAPVPVGGIGIRGGGVPSPMMMGPPTQPVVGPIAGVGGTPYWGMPMTGTPIGLPGPPHLPYGGPAGLKSHTVRNQTKQVIPEPVDHMLIDVKHNPGIRLPRPVKHIEYTENHPSYENEVIQEGPLPPPY